MAINTDYVVSHDRAVRSNIGFDGLGLNSIPVVCNTNMYLNGNFCINFYSEQYG